jgi:hypothetical protein
VLKHHIYMQHNLKKALSSFKPLRLFCLKIPYIDLNVEEINDPNMSWYLKG